MKALALDISKTRTGYAVDDTDGRPRAGSFDAAKGLPNGKAGAAYSRFLCRLIERERPDLIAYETPILPVRDPKTPITMKTVGPLVGLVFLTETIAASYRIDVTDKGASSVRKYFLGEGRPKNRKDAVQERCRILGWAFRNHDEADAMAIWAWAKAARDRKWRLETGTPLFAERAA